MCENHTAQDCLNTLNRLSYLTDDERYQQQQLERIIEREKSDSKPNRRTVCGIGSKHHSSAGTQASRKGKGINPIRAKNCSRRGRPDCSVNQS